RDNLQLVDLDHAKVLPLRVGDALRIEAKTTRPAYFYVLNMVAEGAVVPMYPWNKSQWNDLGDETARTFFSIPDASAGDSAAKVGAGPSGIEAIVVLAREKPFTAEEREQLRKLVQTWPKEQPKFDALRAHVMIGDAEFRFADPRDQKQRGGIDAGDVVAL